MPRRQASLKFAGSNVRGQANVPLVLKSAGVFTAVKKSTTSGATREARRR